MKLRLSFFFLILLAAIAVAQLPKPGGSGGGGGATIASTSSVLKGDGAGNGVAATADVDYASSSALRLVQIQTASNSASLDFTSCFSSTYDQYIIELNSIRPATDETSIQVRLSTDGGSSYATSGYTSSVNVWRTTTAAQASITTYVYIIGAQDNGATKSATATIHLKDVNSTSVHKPYYVATTAIDASSVIGANTVGYYGSTSVVNAFQVIAGSGNLTSGTAACYGVAKQ